MSDVGDMVFPKGGVVIGQDDKGNTTIVPKDGKKDEKVKKQQKENDEIMQIMFKSAEEDVGTKYYLYVYKLVNVAGERTLVMQIPLEQLKEINVETYIKDRVSGEPGGTTYLCYVKDQAGKFPSGDESKKICMRFVFEEDGEIYLKEKAKKEMGQFSRDGRDIGRVFREPSVSPTEMVDAIKEAVNVGVEAGKSKENTDGKMFDTLVSLAKTAAEKQQVPIQQSNSVVELLTAITPLLAPILAKMVEPKPQDNSHLEVLKEITSSMKEISKTISDTNVRIVEKEKEALERQYKDKEALMLLIKESSGQKNDSGVADKFIQQAMQMMDMNSKVQNMTIASIIGLVKNSVELQNVFGKKDEVPEERVPLWESLLEKVFDPSKWKDGVEAINRLKNPNMQVGKQETGQHEENQNITENNDIGDINVSDNLQWLVNNIIADILHQIKSGIKKEDIVNNIVDSYDEYKEDMKKLLTMIQSDFDSCTKLLKPELIAKAALNISKLQGIMDGIKIKLSIIPL